MEFNEKNTHPLPFAQMWDMYRDPAFSIKRLEKLGAVSPTATASGDESAFTVKSSGAVDPEMIPDAAARFVRGTVTVDVEETWHREADSASGTMTIRVNGAPVRVDAKSTLATEGSGTTRTIVGELQVKIPLIGRAVERQAISLIPRLFEAENQAINLYTNSK